jgi:hypothetical protein
MTTELVHRVGYSIAKGRHRWSKRRRDGAPIIVFSMAKTSSSAIIAGLRGAGLDDVHHVHDLDPGFLAAEEADYRWSGRPWRIWDAQQVLRRPPTPSSPWRVVSIVRDPIAQKVSAYFQPAARRGYLHEDTTVGSLMAGFGDRLDHLNVRWFETHVEPALGIDVYASDFDPARGYQIIRTPSVHLLLLRCEDLRVAPASLAELVGADRPIEVPHVNVSAEKGYAEIYREFTRALRPSPASLDQAYESRLVRHFYSRDEIDRFRSLWATPAD